MKAEDQADPHHAERALGPLHGVRIVDFTQLIAGPSATFGLRELGADVIKVERPTGELARSIGGEPGFPPTFAAYNSGKRSIALDLATESGRNAIKRVIAASDIVVEAFRPGAMQRLGLDYATLAAEHPELIYVSFSAYDRNGAGGDRAGVDGVIQGESGVMSITGDADGPPGKAGFQFVDAAAGLAIGQAVLAAVLQRITTGKGAAVELSLFGVATFLQTPIFAAASRSGADVSRPGTSSGLMGAPSDLYRVADGYMMIAAYFPDQWVKFCTALGAERLIAAPQFSTNAERIANKASLNAELAPVLIGRSRSEWASIFAATGVIAGAVYCHLEILDDARLRSLGRFRRVEDELTEPHWIPELPFTSTGWSSPEHGRPPLLGEHTREVLSDAGLGAEEIAALERSGALQAEIAEGW